MDRTKFKLANLDTLMSSNDKLLKIESGIESFLKKVDKQYLDLQNKQSHEWNLKGIEK
jgi:V-type H+-transporting ATPase subunit C